MAGNNIPAWLAALVLVIVGGCAPAIQTTSGAAWLEGYDMAAARAAGGEEMAEDIRVAAAVEPQLVFPARIGIARIGGGRIATVPAAEVASWLALAKDLGPGFGEFVPVSPLIAGLAADAVAAAPRPRQGASSGVGQVIREIRLGAARQHLDAVLVYEVRQWGHDDSTVLSVTDLSIIGMWLVPSRNIEAGALAAAILVDVRNGYPYGQARGEAESSALATSVGASDSLRDLGDEAAAAAVADLAGEVGSMARMLRAELAARPAPD